MIRNKLRIFVVGAAGALVLLIFIASQLVASYERINANNDLASRSYQTLLQLEQLGKILSDAETGQRGFLLTGIDAYLAPYQTALPNIEQATAQLRGLMADNPTQIERLDELSRAIHAKLDELQRTIDLRRSQGMDAAMHVVMTNQGQQYMDQIRGITRDIQDTEKNLLAQHTLATNDAVRNSFIVSSVASLLIVCSLSVALFSLYRELRGHEQTEIELRLARDTLETRVEERTAEVVRAEQRSNFLTEIGRILSSSLEIRSTLQQVAHHILPSWADWCLIAIDSSGTEEAYVVADHIDATNIDRIRALGQEHLVVGRAGRSPVGVRLGSRTRLYTSEILDRLRVVFPDEGQTKLMQEIGINSAIAVPISIGSQIIGSLVMVYSSSARTFESADMFLIEGIADLIGRAVSNARLYLEAQQERRVAEQNAVRITRYQRVIAALSETLSVEKALEIVVDQGVSALGAAAGTISMLTDEQDEIEIVASKGYSSEIIETWHRHSTDMPTISATVITSGRPIWLESRAAALEKDFAPTLDADQVRQSWAGIPLFVQGTIMGAMTLAFENPQTFSPEDKAFILSLSQKCAQAIERSRLYSALLAERERLQVTLSSIGDAVIATDAYGTITFTNRVAQALTAWPAPEAIGKNLSTVFHIINETTHELAESPFTKVIRENDVVGLNNHTLLITRDGKEIPIDDSAAPMRNPGGKIVGVVLVFRNITERRQQEIEIENLLHRYQDLYETCHQIALVSTPKEILQAQISSRYLKHVTQAAILLFDRNWAESPTTFSLSAVYNPDLPMPGLSDDGNLTTSALLRQFSVKELVVNDLDTWPSMDESIRLQASANSMHSLVVYPLVARGNCLGATVLYFNRTNPLNDQDYRHLQTFVEQICVSLDNIQLLKEEQSARQQAEEANQIKLRFLAMISHELRTPLTSIKGFATTLLAKDIDWDTSSQNEFIGIINEEANRLTDLIEQLLDVSRLQAGILRINMEPRRISDIIDTARPQLETLTSNHQLQIQPTTDLPLVNVDAQRISQVLVNLVGNAAKFSPANSTVSISFKTRQKEVQFNVSDQGPGIPESSRQQVFDAFWQAASTGMQEKGIGLGLAIAKGLVEAHGGRIWIEPQSTPGTTISFSLPIFHGIIAYP